MKKNNNGRFPLTKKIKYMLDDFISRGFLAQAFLLAVTSIILTLLFGLIAMEFGEERYVEGYWTSLMHMIDQGTITGDERGTDAYFMFMLFVTFVGMAFTSTIIAIISSAIQGKLEQLQKGYTPVAECDHVVVLGADENAYTICHEIIEGCKIEGQNVCIVVADKQSREEMEHGLKECRADQKVTEKPDEYSSRKCRIKTVFRSGDPMSENTLEICAVSTARAVVINRENDLETIRILLSLASYLKKNGAYLEDDNMPSVVAVIHDSDNMTAAMEAAEISPDGDITSVKKKNLNRIQIVQDEKMLDSLLAHTCVQPGFPVVVEEMFTYAGASVYIEPERNASDAENSSAFEGKTFFEISDMLTGSIPLGLIRETSPGKTEVVLNPPEDTRYASGDSLIYLSKENNLYTEGQNRAEPVGKPVRCSEKEKKTKRNFLFVGSNRELNGIIGSLGGSCENNSTVYVIADEPLEMSQIENTRFSFDTVLCDNPYKWSAVNKIFQEKNFWFSPDDSRRLTNIVLLSPDDTEKHEADEKVTALLLNIRQHLKANGHTDISITTEMHLPKNQNLLKKNIWNDFVVATEITNRMIAQITDEPRKNSVVEAMFENGKTAIELNKLSDYIDTTREFNFECVFRSAKYKDTIASTNEIPLGWIRLNQQTDTEQSDESRNNEIVLNPTREQLDKIYSPGSYDNYRLVVLSDER